MKNNRNWLEILAIVLVFGMAVTGCDPDDKGGNGNDGTNDLPNDGSLDGTWEIGTYALIISGNNFNLTIPLLDDRPYSKGNVTYGGNTFTTTSTHIWTNDSWLNVTSYPISERRFTGNYVLDNDTLEISNYPTPYDFFNGIWILSSTWTDVTSLSQIDGTWKLTQSLSVNEGTYTYTYTTEQTMIINASTSEMSISSKITMTYYSGTAWSSAKSELEESGYIFDDSTYTATKTTIQNLSEEDISLYLGILQINQNGTKIRMGLTIYVKQE